MRSLHVFLLVIFSCFVVVTEARCPSPCTCDSTNNQKRVTCSADNSSEDAPLDDIDSDTEILEISPGRAGSRNAYGSTVPADFDRFPRLSKLVIRNNGIRTIPIITARQLAGLYSLDLSGNSITSLADLSLSTFRDLTVLSLGQNQITSLSTDSLQFLTSLQALNLADNKITSIPANALRSQSLLRVLDLRNNRLRQLPNDFFGSINRVERLDLRGNQLMVLPRGLLRMTALRYLLLDDNQLSTIPVDFVQAWQADHTLSDVTFYGNPLQCDEGLSPLVNWVKTEAGHNQVCVVLGRAGDKAQSGACPVCDSPSNFQGRPIDSLTAEELGSDLSASDGKSSSRFVNSRPVNTRRDTANRQASGDQSSVTFQVIDTARASSSSRRAAGRVPATVRNPIPAGARCSSSKCYVFSAAGQTNWDDARSACKGSGWRLVEIGSALEQQQIFNFLNDVIKEDSSRNSPTGGWWIGARMDQRTQTFVLPSTGRSLPYTNWGRGQPSDVSFAQGCVEMLDTGEWSVLECFSSVNNMYICQYDN